MIRNPSGESKLENKIKSWKKERKERIGNNVKNEKIVESPNVSDRPVSNEKSEIISGGKAENGTRNCTYNGKEYPDFVEILNLFPRDKNSYPMSHDEIDALERKAIHIVDGDNESYPEEMRYFIKLTLADMRHRSNCIRMAKIREIERREDLQRFVKSWEKNPWDQPGWASYTWADMYVADPRTEQLLEYFYHRRETIKEIAGDFNICMPDSMFDSGLITVDSFRNGSKVRFTSDLGEILEPIEQPTSRKRVIIPEPLQNGQPFVETGVDDYVEMYEEDGREVVLIPKNYISRYKKKKKRDFVQESEPEPKLEPVKIVTVAPEERVKEEREQEQEQMPVANVSRGNILKFNGMEINTDIDPDDLFDQILGKR